MKTIGCFITQIGFITQNIALNRISVLFNEIDRLLWGSFFFFPYQYFSWIPCSHILVSSTIELCLQLVRNNPTSPTQYFLSKPSTCLFMALVCHRYLTHLHLCCQSFFYPAICLKLQCISSSDLMSRRLPDPYRVLGKRDITALAKDWIQPVVRIGRASLGSGKVDSHIKFMFCQNLLFIWQSVGSAYLFGRRWVNKPALAQACPCSSFLDQSDLVKVVSDSICPWCRRCYVL